jgi:bleomycin hydrolase
MKNVVLFLGLVWFSVELEAQENRKNKSDGGFKFSEIVDLEATSVKNQYKSGTCWSFSGLSFFESEMIRMGQKPTDLSEMWIVRKAYEMKAERYVRMHGKAQFGPGGQFHDIIDVVKRYGIVAESDYNGQPVHYGKPVHAEMDKMALAMLNVVVSNPNKGLSPYWKNAYLGMLDAYLGVLPENVDPKGYAKSTQLEWDNYVELTSFSHIPFYKKSVLLIPDNWTYGMYYNLPISELFDVAIKAIDAGYTLGWDADVSERIFSFKNGVAIYPDVEYREMPKARRDTLFNGPSNEKILSQEERQVLFENYRTTDDHLMHITGYCKDQNGTTYLIVKNSWGTERNDCGGYIYVSEAYFKAKTIALMIHKAGISKEVSKKIEW